MGQFEQEVRGLAKQRFGSIAELARITNLNEQTLYSVFKGSFASASAATILPIASALEIDPYWLIRGKIVSVSTRSKGFAEVPLFASITAGQSTSFSETDERFAIHRELYERYPSAFLLRVADESVNRILPNGCYALVDPCSTVEQPGQPYAVALDNEPATIKRVRPLANGYELSPDSTDPTFRPALFDFNEPGNPKVQVIGRVVWYCLPINWRFSA